MLAEAAHELQLAIAAVERTGRDLATAELRTAKFGEAGELYAELALVEHARGRNGAAFETSERLRSREMRELVARGRPAAPGGVDPGLVEEGRRLRARIDALESGTAATPVSALMRDVADPPADASASPELARAQTAYAALLQRMSRAAPGYASLLISQATTHRGVAARLRPGEALLEYLVTDSTTLLFVVTRDSTAVIPIPIGRGRLAAAIDFARAAITRRPDAASREPWTPPLRRLHRLLIEPAESSGLLAGVRTLVVAPHAELHYLPFAALMPATGARYLVERYDIAYVPSAAIWAQLGARTAAPAGGKVLVVAPFPTSLPGSRDEAAGIRRHYGRDATVMIGRAATQGAFERAAPSHSIVHLATYGVLNRQNPLFSYVAFAPDSAGAGRLEVQEVFGLSLRARLLVLSACESGLGSGAASDVPPGDDWVGLVRAFLFAGADNVMATLWPIEDRSTSLIIPEFYASLGRDGVARALGAAQRAALRNGATSAPRHWAAFVLVGSVR